MNNEADGLMEWCHQYVFAEHMMLNDAHAWMKVDRMHTNESCNHYY